MRRRTNRRASTLAPTIVVALIAVTGAALFLTQERQIAGAWGFSLDDSWIHATIARNLATGHGYSFNPGETTGGSTAPLYTFLLAALFLATGPSVFAVKMIGVLAHACACVLLYDALLATRNKTIAFGSALLAAASPSLLWASVSGMEISIYILLLVAGIHCHLRGRVLLGTALWSLGVWVRPDGMLLPILSVVALSGRRLGRLGVFAAAAAPYFVFNLLVGHFPFPTTVLAKAHSDGIHQVLGFLRSQGYLWGFQTQAGQGVLQSPFLLAAATVGGLAGGKIPRFLLLYAGVFVLVFGLVATNAGPQHRYVLPLIPIVIALACYGVGIAATRIHSPVLRVILAVLLLGPSLLTVPGMANLHAWNVQNINGMQRFMGELVLAKTDPSDRVATNDIGAIGFFSKRYIVDTAGLISPREPLPTLLTTYRPRLLIIYPNWYKAYGHVDVGSRDLYFDDADSTNRYWGLFGVQLRYNTVSSRDKLLVFVRSKRGAPAPEREWMYQH